MFLFFWYIPKYLRVKCFDVCKEKRLYICGRQNKCLPKMYILIPRTYDCVLLHDKREFAGVIKDLKMRKLFWATYMCQHNHKNPYKE